MLCLHWASGRLSRVQHLLLPGEDQRPETELEMVPDRAGSDRICRRELRVPIRGPASCRIIEKMGPIWAGKAWPFQLCNQRASFEVAAISDLIFRRNWESAFRQFHV